MSITTGEFTVFAGSRRAGTVSISQNGLMTAFDCACTSASREILRLAAVCAGRYIPLGVMIPGDRPDVLRFTKSFSKNTLASMGYDNATAYHLIRSGDVYTEASAEPAAAALSPAGPPAELPPITPISPAASSVRPMTDVPSDMSWNAPDETIPDDLPFAVHGPGFETESLTDPSNDDYKRYDAPMPSANGAAAAEPVGEESEISDTRRPTRFETQVPVADDVLASPAAEPASDEVTEELLAALLEMTLKSRSEAAEATEASAFVSEPPQDDVWYPAENPASLFDDPEISKSCENVMGALAKTEDDTLMLAVPVSPDEPFSMMPVFCFGSPRQIDGMDYIVFKIKDGYLTL
jgi:hypothetical protein